jgi:hypothetical protein
MKPNFNMGIMPEKIVLFQKGRPEKWWDTEIAKRRVAKKSKSEK